jgi:hypothetical protein
MNSRAHKNLGSAFAAAALCGTLMCSGCDSQQNTASRTPVQEPLPVGTTQTAHEDDVIAPLYSNSDAATSAASNTRTSTPQSGAIKIPPAPETVEGPSADRSTEADETQEQPPALTDLARRTSMPQRRGSTSAVVKGGVRKALPVAQAASPLFGKWTVDTERSSKGFVNADSILFLADGRLRVWKGGAPEDGRWTWDPSDGIKTGGIDGVPLTLGPFDQEAGEVIITQSGSGETQTLVLQPDRLFVAPPPVSTGTPSRPQAAPSR